MNEFVVGQRWVSHTESNLGLGIVTEVMHRRVQIHFPAAQEQRMYSSHSAPLMRVVYKCSDFIKDAQGNDYTVLNVVERAGLIFYEFKNECGDNNLLPETELSSVVKFNNPKERLLAGQIDSLRFYNLRQDTLSYSHQYQQSNVQGLLGPRIQLLPHQLYIAYQVANRNAPRVLLADEVGLGKTIEAGLIIHKQLQTGLAQRVLILVPDSLLHQWLIEMRRRFSLAFSILNHKMCEEAFHQTENPFEASQLILCPLSFLVEDAERAKQALSCAWDLLVVDEAHHLQWSQQQASCSYLCVEALAAKTQGMLLLTATPQQLGIEGHFARLRLLDPNRYYDLAEFLAEENSYQAISDVATKIVDAKYNNMVFPERELALYLGAAELAPILQVHRSGNIGAACDQALDALLDRHSTGRVLFKNTRAAIKQFADRILCAYPLQWQHTLPIAHEPMDILYPENLFSQDWVQHDLRVTWLLQWLKEHAIDRVLLICARAKTAIELEEHLRARYAVRCALFHEEMSVIARDRAAAYFADEEQSAQILICSEIGSEGRNFQFLHHIILFDLPLNPDLLEQRIGRLDRIGQKNNIYIHVPYYEHSAQQVLFNWYHYGLNAFAKTCDIGNTVFTEYERELLSCMVTADPQAIHTLVMQTCDYATALREKLDKGRNKLLELNACRVHVAEEIISNIINCERRKDLESFLERSFDQLGIEVEAHSANIIILRPSENMRCGLLPGLQDEGVTATYSRDIALQREDIQFLTWENPIVKSAMEYILNGHHGNVAFATLKLKPLKPGTLLLEALFTVQCIAPVHLNIGRYLPLNVLRVLVDAEGKDLSQLLSTSELNHRLRAVPISSAYAVVKNTTKSIEHLIACAQQCVIAQQQNIIEEALNNMQSTQQRDLLRLKTMAKINPNVRQDEIDELEQSNKLLQDYLQTLELKIDALRLIVAV